MRHLVVLLASVFFLGGCSDPTGPSLTVSVLHVFTTATSEWVGGATTLNYENWCGAGFMITAVAGRSGEAVLFESGEIRVTRANGSRRSPLPIDRETFADWFGTDRVASGETLRNSHYVGVRGWHESDEPWTQRYTFRFRMPDGALISRSEIVICAP